MPTAREPEVDHAGAAHRLHPDENGRNEHLTSDHLRSHVKVLAFFSWEGSVALHISGKLLALGLVITALITAFSAPRETAPDGRSDGQSELVQLAIAPVATIRETPVQTDEH